MAELYQVLPVEGKGLGIVASKSIKRGSLILKEQPQMPPVSLELDLKGRFKQVVSFFEKMSQTDQIEYLKLYNKFDSEYAKNDAKQSSDLRMFKTDATEIASDPELAEKMLKIVCIYLTNQFEEGVRIKVSRLNHSCQPNARILPENGEVRAISDIKSGEEITISYG